MMYGRLNNGSLESAPENIVVDGVIYRPATDAALEAAGYKKVYYTDCPDDGNEYAASWKETAKKITQKWTLVRTVKNAEKRKRKYGDTPLVEYDGETLTVDEAVQLWCSYAAEGKNVNQLQKKIAAAKEAIRAELPDEEGV